MLKRIAVVTRDKAVLGKVTDASTKGDVEFVTAEPGASLPAGADGLVTCVKEHSQAVAAALSMAERNEEMLFLLAEALDCREGVPLGSSRRVMEHASRFGQALGLSVEERFVLERGALLRDIGKIRIPNEVLLKEGLLTYDEWRLIHEHPHLGMDLIAQTEALKHLSDIVRNHHECFDGDGYPDGLEGEAIPRLARMVKILDVYCAMTSPRHYRKGQSNHGEAVEYLRSEQGKHFDPQLVEVFIEANIGQAGAK